MPKTRSIVNNDKELNAVVDTNEEEIDSDSDTDSEDEPIVQVIEESQKQLKSRKKEFISVPPQRQGKTTCSVILRKGTKYEVGGMTFHRNVVVEVDRSHMAMFRSNARFLVRD